MTKSSLSGKLIEKNMENAATRKSYLSKMQTFSFFEYFGTQTYTFKSVFVTNEFFKKRHSLEERQQFFKK